MAYEGTSATKMRELLDRANARIAGIKERAQEGIREGKAYMETDGTAFVFGYLRGRMTDPAEEDSFMVAGVAPDLLAGGALATIAFLGAFGPYAEDGHNVARGALASYATVKGVEFGVEAREKAGEGSGALSIGTPGVGTRGTRQLGGRRGEQIGARRSSRNAADQMAGGSRSGA